ncbi:glycosyltransferase family 2 protein [Hydrogenophaga sp.]|uniref:glycosyltransferase family 2 protein n=1 Tax=Hydrogenophaga sp. TaxID=1904254 RepID=UPI00356A5E5B
MKTAPRVSIGMPIYNGEETIAASIESLLAQSLGDFELIVSDNASTDQSVAIVQRYQQQDSRIRLIRQAHNVGANGNFSAVVDAATGEYFKWTTCSDLCSPNFLQACVDVLDQRPDVVLAAPQTLLFEADPDVHKVYDGDIEVQDSSPARRFVQLIQRLQLNNAMNGVIRTQALRYKRPIIDHFLKADIVMVSCLALQGGFALVPQALFLRRMDPKTATSLMSPEDDIKHHYPVMSWKALFPTWRLFWGWRQAVWQTPVPNQDKTEACRYLRKMCVWEWKEFVRDLVSGLAYFLKLRWLNTGRRA